MVGEVTRYLLRRIGLLLPTLLAIIGLNFCIVQFAPGGPVESVMQKFHAAGGEAALPGAYRGGQGVDAAEVAQLRQQFGFDQPLLLRFAHMVRGYATFDLGESFFQGASVAALIWQRLPVSLSLGFWSTLIVYAVSIPLGVGKAVWKESRFDAVTTVLIMAGYAVPGFLLAIFLLVFFGEGGVFPLFPLRGLGDGSVADYVWHLVLPTVAMTTGGFATLTVLTKNSFLEEVGKLYVMAARAKGASEARVIWRHVMPNALLLIVAGFPAAFVSILFTSALLVEIVFSLNGLGQLGFQAVLERDYPVMFGTLYIYTLTGLVMQILGDLLLTVIDPRISFEAGG